MTPDDDIYHCLSGAAGVTALVTTRIYAMEAPQNPTCPYIAFQLISDVPDLALPNAIVKRNARYQVSCYATTRAGARSLSDAVITAMQGYRSGTIEQATFLNRLEIREDGAGPDGGPLYHVPTDFSIRF